MADNDQPTLFPTGPMARPTDPPTSAAAPPALHVMTELQGWVMCAHLARLGLTDEELCDEFPNHHPGTIIKRRGELVNAGLLVDAGTTRQNRRFRSMVVWKRTPEAEEKAGIR